MSEQQVRGLVALEYDMIAAAAALGTVARTVRKNRRGLRGAEDVLTRIEGMRRWLLEILQEVDAPISDEVDVFENKAG